MKKYLILFTAVVLLMLTPLSVSAVEVNGNEAQLGQTVTYEIHASGCMSVIQAIDIEVTYDSTALEYIKDSIQMPNLRGTLVNDADKDSIKFNAIDLEGFSFYEDNIVASMQFRVISDHAPYLYIKSDVRNFIDDSLVDHKDEYVFYLTLSEDEIQQIETVSEEIAEQHGESSSREENTVSAEPKTSDSGSAVSSESEVRESSSVSSAEEESGTGGSISEPVPSSERVGTADSPYGSNPHDDTVTAVASKPANYSVMFFAAAGMLVIIAIIAIVFLAVMKHSDSDKKSD